MNNFGEASEYTPFGWLVIRGDSLNRGITYVPRLKRRARPSVRSKNQKVQAGKHKTAGKGRRASPESGIPSITRDQVTMLPWTGVFGRALTTVSHERRVRFAVCDGYTRFEKLRQQIIFIIN